MKQKKKVSFGEFYVWMVDSLECDELDYKKEFAFIMERMKKQDKKDIKQLENSDKSH